ncbi:hypothetical protein KGQ20_16470 [Catenulispora sp. NF23]|uniref:hypothetical protein n=1 Tax=Catenulispora pinistramenti TaxID=2705254 RepID=UPI001BA7D3EB|nr:hypothetical protein [Catenulispora pinistramenti]MBS2534366.1 hypothetical protein [Catenulispora pinistramenti]
MDDESGRDRRAFSIQAAGYGMTVTGGVHGPVTFYGTRATPGSHRRGSQIACQKATVRAIRIRNALGDMAEAFGQFAVAFSRIVEQGDGQ